MDLRAWSDQEDHLERVFQGQRSEINTVTCRKCKNGELFGFKMCLCFFLLSRVIMVLKGIEARKGSKVTVGILEHQANL